MSKKWIAINIVLILITGLLAWKVRVAADRYNAENDLSRIQPARNPKQKIANPGGMAALKPPRVYNAAEFGMIPAQNVFSETRTREEKVEAAPVVPVIPELTQKPVLVGVTMFGNKQMAIIIDPTSPNAGGNRRTQTKRVGDVYQGYTITDITPSQLVLENGNRREVIPLYDGSKHSIKGGKTPILATRVVGFGGSGQSGTSAVATISSPGGAVAPARAATPTPTTPVTPIIGGQNQAPITAGSATGIRTIQPSRPAPQPTPGPNDRVIRTPFGDIVRPDKP